LKHHDSYDPWLEIDAAAFQHNAREAARLAGGRPLMAVVKNNAYGLGDEVVGPIMDSCQEVGAIACVRVAEALALRRAGVKKPILVMAEVSEEEGVTLMQHQVWLSAWRDDAPERLARIAQRVGRAVPVHLFIDSGMGREGMPDYRALPWLETLHHHPAVKIMGTYMTFTHELDFDGEQLSRFNALITKARQKGIELGCLHAAPSYELFQMPAAHLDMVRIGNALFGNYPDAAGMDDLAALRPVFRLRARVTRLEQLRPGDGSNFRRLYVAQRPTWVALLPIGHTDGYPPTAADTCQVLIRDRLYPVVGTVSCAHVIVEIGDEKSIDVGDVATLIGPDDPEITPQSVAEKTGVRFLSIITKLNARLPRVVV
jgi:alanine racemase